MAASHIYGEELRHPDPGNWGDPGKASPTDMEAHSREPVKNLEMQCSGTSLG